MCACPRKTASWAAPRGTPAGTRCWPFWARPGSGGASSREQAAIDLAAAQYDGAYDTAWGRYDVTTGCWVVTFSKGAVGGGNAAILYVDSGGAVSDEQVWMCIEGPMEDTGAAN